MTTVRKENPEDFTESEQKQIDSYAKRSNRVIDALGKMGEAIEARQRIGAAGGERVMATNGAGLLVTRTPGQVLFDAARIQAEAMRELDAALGFDNILTLVVQQQQQIADLQHQLRSLAQALVLDTTAPRRPMGPQGEQ